MMVDHPFHKHIGRVLREVKLLDHAELSFDSACEFKGNYPEIHNLPLYRDTVDPRVNRKKLVEMCDVDAFITFVDRIKVIIEIEESGIRANKLCSKYLSASLASYYKRGGVTKHLSESVTFIQIVNTHYSRGEDPMEPDWCYLAKAFNEIKIPEGRITRYRLFWGNYGYLIGSNGENLIDTIYEALDSSQTL